MVTKLTTEPIAPERTKMSYEAYLKWASNDRIMEWVDGEGPEPICPIFPTTDN